MGTFCYYFNTAFPVKATHVKESIVNKWITKGITVSRNRLRLLCKKKKIHESSCGILKVYSELSIDLQESNKRGKKERGR